MAFSLDYTGNNDMSGFFSGYYWPTACLENNHDEYVRQCTRVMHGGMETQRRRKRTTFSKAQLGELERTFSLTQYPDVKIKESLSSLTGLPESKIQVWFQNRRARYFKNKKAKRELKSPLNQTNFPDIYTSTTACSGPSRSLSHSFSARYPSPSLPQHVEVPTVQGSQARPLSAPSSPIPADQATFYYVERNIFALSPQQYGHYPDFTGCNDAHMSSRSPNRCNFLQDFDALFRYDQGSLPTGSRCDEDSHHLAVDNGLFSEVKDLLQFHDFVDGRQQQTEVPDYISELCLQELGEFDMTDLEISPAMIDYLLS